MAVPIRVIVNGARGRMGSLAVAALEKDPSFEVVGRLDRGDSLDAVLVAEKPDVAVDFTQPEIVYRASRTILEHGVRPVIGTTGLTPQQIAELQELSVSREVGGIIAPNFALGAVLLMHFSAIAARYLPDVEIVELHHNQKLDSPSGTALKTASLIAESRQTSGGKPAEDAGQRKPGALPGARGATAHGVHIHSVRLPGFVAHEEVIFGGQSEILTLRHDSMHRECFMPGVLLACREVMKQNRLVYGLEHLMGLSHNP